MAAAALTLPPSAYAAPGDIDASVAVDVNPSGPSGPSRLVNVGGTLFFSATDPVYGRELWKSDGTPAGTTRLSDINPTGDGLSSSTDLFSAGGTLFFAGFNGVTERLYKVEPPYSGPPVLIDVNPGGDMVSFNGILYFPGFDGSGSGQELWRSDGGPVGSGTEMVVDINTDPGESSFPEDLTVAGNSLFFAANDGGDGVDGRELWRSDGTIGDADDLEINSTPGEGSQPDNLTNAGGTLFLSADNGTAGEELWKAGETDSSATMIEIVSGSGGSSPSDFGALGSTLYFNADDGVNGAELWKSDGGPLGGGTAMVADINPGPGDSFPEGPTAFNGYIYVAASDGVTGQEVWRSNGGPLGPGSTEMVADVNPGPGGGSIDFAAVFGGALWFRGAGANGSELWKTSGAGAQTADIYPGPLGSVPAEFAVGNDALYFSADDGTATGRELWKATIEPPVSNPPEPPAPAPKKCKKGRKLKKGKCVKKKRRKKK